VGKQHKAKCKFTKF